MAEKPKHPPARTPPAAGVKSARLKRQEQALRANLRRRKKQGKP